MTGKQGVVYYKKSSSAGSDVLRGDERKGYEIRNFYE